MYGGGGVGGGGEFDGSAAAFMGGGFMPTQTTQAPDSSYSSSKNREAKCLLPMTVKQLHNAFSKDDSSFFADGVEVNSVTVLGRVCQKEDKASEYTITIDDGTGQIGCSKWIQEFIDTEELGGILMGMYVRVHGHLKSMQGRRFINVFSIRPVTDFNEIPSHFIECIYVHFYNTKLKSHASDGPNDIGQMILNLLLHGNEEGMHRSVISQQLKIPVPKLADELQALVENGLIYTTIDEDHYKSTVNG